MPNLTKIFLNGIQAHIFCTIILILFLNTPIGRLCKMQLNIKMAISEDVLVSELNKINKKDIIHTLVFRKMNDQIISNNVLSVFFGKLFSVKDYSDFNNSELSDDEFADTMDSLPECSKSKCTFTKLQCVSLKRELKCHNVTIYHIEKRLQEQEMLISLLKNKSDNFVNNELIPPSTDSSAKIDNSGKINRIKPSSHRKELPAGTENAKQTKTATDGAISLSQVKRGVDMALATVHQKSENERSSTNENRPFKFAQNRLGNHHSNRYRQRRVFRKPVVGSNENSDVKTVQKLGYLHVYRLDPSMTAVDLNECLKKSAPDIRFDCKELNKTDKSLSCIVSFPLHFVGDVYNPAIWPSGACINRYKFPKDNRSNEQDHSNFLSRVPDNRST